MSEDHREPTIDTSITASGAQEQVSVAGEQVVTTRTTAEPDDADHVTESADQERRGYPDEPTTS